MRCDELRARQPVSYSEPASAICRHLAVASLLFVTGEKAIRHLLSRETYSEFSWPVLLAVLGMYFFGVCYASGTSISSGVVVPQL